MEEIKPLNSQLFSIEYKLKKATIMVAFLVYVAI